MTTTMTTPTTKESEQLPPIVLILDNIRSLYNVGSMFRTADGLGVSKIYLSGYTGTPEQKGLTKVSLGAESSVAWEKRPHAWRVIEQLRREGYQVVGLECGVRAIPLPAFKPKFPVALLMGNEVNGLSPAIRRRLDAVLEIPMFGIKESFNVSVACAIGLYHLRNGRNI